MVRFQKLLTNLFVTRQVHAANNRWYKGISRIKTGFRGFLERKDVKEVVI
jgi:hypothetical protein